jgi:hypothetical protein
MRKTLPAGVAADGHERAAAPDSSGPGRWRIVPFLLIGVLGALAFGSESPHQNWGAVFAALYVRVITSTKRTDMSRSIIT